MPDIDIDFADRSKILEIIKHVPAAIKDNNGTFKKHNTGVYCHSIPYNPLTGLSSFEYKEAEDRGYFKIDFLNVGIYEKVKNEEHLLSLMNQEPLWDLLEQDDFTNLLFHVNGYGNLLRKLKPTSVVQLAACLALIRPGKKHLQDETWDNIMKTIWDKPASGEYHFKKAHAVAYAMAVVVQMNLICESISYEFS
jgi:DNA polymerase III alpha subunit